MTLAQMSLTLEEVACTEVTIGEEEHQGMLARLDHITGLAPHDHKIAGSESTLAKGKGKGKAKVVGEDYTSEDKGMVEELGEMACKEPEGANEQRPFDKNMAKGANGTDGSLMDLQHIRVEFMKVVMRPIVEGVLGGEHCITAPGRMLIHHQEVSRRQRGKKHGLLSAICPTMHEFLSTSEANP